jgi:O-antigen ligase
MNNEVLKGTIAILGLIVIIFVFCFLFLKVLRMVLQHRANRDAAQIQVLMKLADQGAPIPVELIALYAGEKLQNDMRRGIVLICFGLGLILCLFSLGSASTWGLGLIPVFTGVGYLLSAKLAQKATHS